MRLNQLCHFVWITITEKDYEEVGIDSTEEAGEGDEY